MRFEFLKTRFLELNPDGAMYRASELGGSGYDTGIMVRFGKDGKLYRYADSVLGVAERLDLIPAMISIKVDADRCIDAFRNGADEYLTVQSIASTVRHVLRERDIDIAIVSDPFYRARDDYGRDIDRFVLADPCDPWSNND